MRPRSTMLAWSVALLTAVFLACGGDEAPQQGGRPGGGRGGGRPGGGPGGGFPGAFGGGESGSTSVPVEVAAVERRAIAASLETNGTLEAENEVDLIARATGPIIELLVEEGNAVSKGRLLARIDPAEARTAYSNAEASAEEAALAFGRAERLRNDELISEEEYEQARARNLSAQAQLETLALEVGYTEIRAPFGGLVVTRYIRQAQYVSPGTALFRLSDFDPLLCPVQVPERELPRLSKGQQAHLVVEAWPDRRFKAKVLRISPTVEAATGTVKVTLAVEREGLLRPGMFAKVFLEIDRREGALVIPKEALALEGIGDAVYVVADGSATRRDVEVGFSEGDHVEILTGLGEGEQVVVVGQDGLSDGTPVRILGAEGDGGGAGPPGGAAAQGEAASRLEMARERMRSMGMTEEEIDQRVEEMRRRFGGGSSGDSPGPSATPSAPPPTAGGAPDGAAPSNDGPTTEPARGEGRPRREGGVPPPAGRPGEGPSMNRGDAAERTERARERMRAMGLSEEEIEQRIEEARQRFAGRPGAGAGADGRGRPGGPGRSGGPPPGFGPGEGFELTSERIEMIRQRMRDRGFSDEEIENRIEEMRKRLEGNDDEGGEG